METITEQKPLNEDQQHPSHNYYYFLGIRFKSDSIQGVDYREIAARLFLSPCIPCAKINAIVNSLENKKLSIDSFLRRTDLQIKQLRDKNDIDISDKMVDKIESWIDDFGFNRDELDFIKDRYGLTYEDLMSSVATPEIPTAKELADYVKQFVIGQDESIDQLAVPFAQHLESKRNGSYSPIKTPVLLLGPTGVGKSEIYRRFAEICECPVVRINTTEITPQSWRGLHIPDFFLSALKSGTPVEELEYAIVVFNEFDKITHYGNRITSEKGSDMDMDLQRDVMQLFDYGNSISIVDDTPLSNFSRIQLPVNNLLIVFDGAFSGIEEIIKVRCNARNTIGFVTQETSQTERNWMKLVCEKDLEEWGYIPELLGRIGLTCVLNPLSTSMMMKIMTEAKESALQAHIDYCKQHNVNLVFTDDAKYYIAELAQKSGLGFRNVKTLLARCLSPMYFRMGHAVDNQEQLVNVDKAYIEKALNR